VAFARTHLQWWGWRGWCEVFLLQLMSQLIRDLDFGIGSEANRRITVVIVVVQFNLEHDGLLLLEGADPLGRRTLTCISCASNEISCQNRLRSPSAEHEMLDLKHSV
jgi:hypothetical protein